MHTHTHTHTHTTYGGSLHMNYRRALYSTELNEHTNTSNFYLSCSQNEYTGIPPISLPHFLSLSLSMVCVRCRHCAVADEEPHHWWSRLVFSEHVCPDKAVKQARYHHIPLSNLIKCVADTNKPLHHGARSLDTSTVVCVSRRVGSQCDANQRGVVCRVFLFSRSNSHRKPHRRPGLHLPYLRPRPHTKGWWDVLPLPGTTASYGWVTRESDVCLINCAHICAQGDVLMQLWKTFWQQDFLCHEAEYILYIFLFSLDVNVTGRLAAEVASALHQ